MSESDELARAIKNVIDRKVAKASSGTRTKTTGKVVLVNPDGTAVVDAGSGGTPVEKSAVSVKVGDEVSVTVRDGKATIDENYTDPAASSEKVVKVEARAIDAQAEATRAFMAANAAEQDAARAHDAADAAQASADTAATAAGNAQTSADNAAADAAQAHTEATHANLYANSALDQLGIVQDVVGVLDWASKHGTFARTSDTAIVDGKVYFTYDAQTGDYAPVVEPQASQLANYYELSMSEAMDDFILAHLAVTQRGLWVLPSGKGSASDEQHAPGYKLLLASDGSYLYDASGVLVRSDTASGTTFASGNDWHVGGEDAYIFYDASEGTLTLGGSNIVLGSGKTLSELVEESGMRGYSVEIAATATDTASGAVTLTATVRKDGAALTAAEVLRVGAVKWYRADTGARVGVGLTLSATSGVRYLARLEG